MVPMSPESLSLKKMILGLQKLPEQKHHHLVPTAGQLHVRLLPVTYLLYPHLACYLYMVGTMIIPIFEGKKKKKKPAERGETKCPTPIAITENCNMWTIPTK